MTATQLIIDIKKLFTIQLFLKKPWIELIKIQKLCEG